MSRLHRGAAALFLSLLLSSTTVSAADVWDSRPFEADPKALLAAANAVKPKDPDGGVIVLLDEVVVRIDYKGKATRVERLIYKVLDESAVEEWSSIEAGWSPWYHDRPQVDARVISATGEVYRLDQKSFGTSDAEDEPDMFSDTRVVSGPLPAVAKGAVVEQTITIHEKNPLAGSGISDRQDFGRWVETRQSRLVIEHPTSQPPIIVNRTAPHIDPRKSERDGVTKLVFETGPIAANDDVEWSVPADAAKRSYVAWSTGRDWQTVAHRYAAIVDEKIGDTASLARVVSTAIGDARTPRAITERLLQNVTRRIRYAGVEFGENSIFPRTPAETLKNQYGDCKDKATLLIALLRQAGVTARPVLIRSGYDYDVDPDLPGFGPFNHVIVQVQDKEPFWVDPTDDFARAGELPGVDQGRRVLIASPATTALTTTPRAEGIANRTVESREFWLPEAGRARVVEVTEYSGNDESSVRNSWANIDRKGGDEHMKKYAEEMYVAKEVAKWDRSDPYDLSRPFRITLEMKEAKRGITADGEAAVGMFPSALAAHFPSSLRVTDEQREENDLKPRKRDFEFYDAFVVELQHRVHPPVGYVLRTTPPSETIPLGSAKMTKEVRVENDGTVAVNYRVESGPRRLTPAQFEETRKAVSKLAQEEPWLLYFDSVARKHLDAGEIGKAVEEHRRLAALHPKEALHRSDAALALLAGGMGAAARREARSATELEPKSARAFSTLGTVLASDLIGRELRAGSDVKGAIAAYQKAKLLDPTDTLIRAQLSVLLQYSDDAERYGDPARVDQAIAEYVALKKMDDVNVDFIDRELMTLYMKRQKWDELRKLLAETKDTEQKNSFKLVLAGATEGAAAALRKSNELEVATRRAAQAAAAAQLASLRLYQVASELFAAAAQGAPNAAQLRQQADVLRKVVPHEQLKIDSSRPESIVQSFFLEMMNDADEDEITRKYAAKEVASVFDGPGLSDARKAGSAEARSRKRAQKAAMESAVIADIGLSVLDFQRDGDDNGLRLRARFPGAAAKGEFDLFVVKEGADYRFVGDGEHPSFLALRALRHAEKSEVEQARRWLDWARDYVSAANEDPVENDPFAGVWTRGRQASADELRLAAAMLLPETRKSAEIALPILTAARERAEADVQWRIDSALSRCYALTEKWSDLLATGQRLSSRFPESGKAFGVQVQALEALGRTADARKLASERLAHLPGDVTALRYLAMDGLSAGRYVEAKSFYTKLVELSKPAPNDYNNQAWVALFTGGPLEEAAQAARHAVDAEPGSYASLNTLAAIYAEQGKTSEARETLLKSVQERDSEEFSGADWYVLGRIAENYGINDAAKEAYAKVPKPVVEGGSSWKLVQQRLGSLKK